MATNGHNVVRDIFKIRVNLGTIILIGLCLFAPPGADGAENAGIVPGQNVLSGIDRLDIKTLREYRSDLGIKNLEPYSIVLISKGLEASQEGRDEDALAYFNQAKDLSPDVPVSYLYLSQAHLSPFGGVVTSSGYLLDAWEAFKRNFWWSFRTYGMVLMGFFMTFYITFIMFSASLIFSRYHLYLHDVTENRKKGLLLLPSFVLSFAGPVFGIAGLMLPFWTYLKTRERAVYCLSLAVILLMFIMLPLVSTMFKSLQDKTLQDVIRVNNGIYTGDTMRLSANDEGYEYFFTQALEQQRRKNYGEAIKMYTGILNRGDDAKVYNNIANCYLGLNDYNSAIKTYNKALEVNKTPLVYFNLSQLYREAFNFDEAERYYDLAMSLDPKKVAVYNTMKGTSGNSLVVDGTLSKETLWDLALKRGRQNGPAPLKRMVSFVSREISIVLLLAFIPGFYLYRKKVPYGAYRCRRCGKVFCRHCEKRISREDVCLTCFKTLIKVSEMKSRERIEKIREIQQYREEVLKRLRILTYIVPGGGHVYFGWPVFGFLVIFLCAFFVSWGFLWVYFPVPASMSQIPAYIRWFPAFGLIAVYFFAIENVLRRIPGKWL